MAEERRYSDHEIERIFSIAAGTTPAPRDAGTGGGLTLPELQEIGSDVGLSPAEVARAAALLDGQGLEQRRVTIAGIPIGVERTFSLPRAPTGREWAMLVAELRRSFAAQGTISSTGELWEWRNGNLFASIEPTSDGYRLRLGTRKGSAPFLAVAGAGWLLVGSAVLSGGDPPGGMFGLFLSLCFLVPLLRLPWWAKLREEQMEAIGKWMLDMLREPAKLDPGPAT